MVRKRMPPLVWARKHVNNLKKKKDELYQMEIYSTIKKYLKECGPYDYSVGYWTILKQLSLAYCINPFGKILIKKRIRDTVYLDLFCGAGITPIKGSEDSKGEWIVGSPIISTRMTDYPFKKYYFGDLNKRSIQLLEGILNEWDETSREKRDYELLHEDANIALKKLLPKIKGKYLFAFIDSSGFKWDWKSMKSLLYFKRFDIIMNFQTRQVDRIPENKQKSFFGPCSSKLRYLGNCDEKLNAYITQIKEFGLNVIPIKIGMDRTNQYYYHLLHISRLDTYKNIILDMKDRVERFNGKSIKMIWDDLHGRSRQTSLEVD